MIKWSAHEVKIHFRLRSKQNDHVEIRIWNRNVWLGFYKKFINLPSNGSIKPFPSPVITDRVKDIKLIHVNWTTKSFADNDDDDVICLFLAMCLSVDEFTNLLPGERKINVEKLRVIEMDAEIGIKILIIIHSLSHLSSRLCWPFKSLNNHSLSHEYFLLTSLHKRICNEFNYLFHSFYFYSLFLQNLIIFLIRYRPSSDSKNSREWNRWDEMPELQNAVRQGKEEKAHR